MVLRTFDILLIVMDLGIRVADVLILIDSEVSMGEPWLVVVIFVIVINLSRVLEIMIVCLMGSPKSSFVAFWGSGTSFLFLHRAFMSYKLSKAMIILSTNYLS